MQLKCSPKVAIPNNKETSDDHHHHRHNLCPMDMAAPTLESWIGLNSHDSNSHWTVWGLPLNRHAEDCTLLCHATVNSAHSTDQLLYQPNLCPKQTFCKVPSSNRHYTSNEQQFWNKKPKVHGQSCHQPSADGK